MARFTAPGPESAPPRLAPVRLRPSDILRVGGAGLRTRPLRVFLSALGIAIGIAAMVAVVGISTSSQAELDRQLASLGANLLTVSPGQTMFGRDATLPTEAESMIDRIGPVMSTSAVGRVGDAKVYRSDLIPEVQTGGLTTYAARLDLPETVGAQVRTGRWLNAATARYPAVVLGSTAAERLGIGHAGSDVRILVGGEWFTVVGILEPAPLASELDGGADRMGGRGHLPGLRRLSHDGLHPFRGHPGGRCAGRPRRDGESRGAERGGRLTSLRRPGRPARRW
jgi:putative ABC transport system permease protein